MESKMKKFILLIIIAVIMAAMVSCSEPVMYENTLAAPTTFETQSSGTFEAQLFGAMPTDQNYMISPFSLRMALAMAANGASGQTKDEILAALDIADLGEFNQRASEFIRISNVNEAVEFNIANSIWFNHDFFGRDEVGFLDDYRNIIENYFAGVADRIDNATGADAVNDWISYQTKDRINDVVDPGSVAGTLAFLVNTIYFKGDWATQFDEQETREDIFTDRNGIRTSIDFMHITYYFDYFENDYFQMLAKPYADESIRMYLVLPKTDQRLCFNLFEDAIDNMSTRKIELLLPRFETEFLHEDLVAIMRRMGVTRAFCDVTAEFFEMFTDLPMGWPAYIGDILQKTFIEVNEEGTEAAAATVIYMFAESWVPPPPPPIPFYCNRPFIYFIRNDITNDILFMGEFAFAG